MASSEEQLAKLVGIYNEFKAKVEASKKATPDVGQLREQLTEVKAGVWSDDRSVRVVVGPGGGVQDVHLSPEALRQQPSALSASILTTIRRAVADAAQQQAQIMSAGFGRDDVADVVLANQARAMGTTVEELTDPAPVQPATDDDGWASPAAPDPAEPDVDDDNRSIYER